MNEEEHVLLSYIHDDIPVSHVHVAISIVIAMHLGVRIHMPNLQTAINGMHQTKGSRDN